MTIVFVDTPRACPSYMKAPYGDCNENCMLQLANNTVGMPCTEATSLECWLSHVAWLNETLAAVTTKWKFVAGVRCAPARVPTVRPPPLSRPHAPRATPPSPFSQHHPIDDEHMPYMMPALNAHGVQAYFAGHVHNLQHAAEKGSLVQYFVSGAGAFGSAYEMEAARLAEQGVALGTTHKPRALTHPEGRAWSAANWVGTGPGCLTIVLDGDVARATFYNHYGSALYTSNFTASV